MKQSNIQKILLATDFSDNAVLAHDYARYLALTLGASLHVLYVSESAQASSRGELPAREAHVQTLLRTLQERIWIARKYGRTRDKSWILSGAYRPVSSEGSEFLREDLDGHHCNSPYSGTD